MDLCSTRSFENERVLTFFPFLSVKQHRCIAASLYLYCSQANEGVNGVFERVLLSLHEQTRHHQPRLLQRRIGPQNGVSEVWQLHETAAHPGPLRPHTCITDSV